VEQVGMSGPDQREIDVNKVACLLNVAACNIAMKDYGQAVKHSTEAVELDPKNVKALLRRAKALIGRREYDVSTARPRCTLTPPHGVAVD
jgi:Tfp pilus assembly protein PilF